MAAYDRRSFAGGAQPATLTALAGAADPVIYVSTTVGWPNLATGKFYIVVDPGNPSEETMLVTAYTSSSVTVTRGADGTTGTTHQIGADLYPCTSSVDMDEANQAVVQTIGKITTAGDLLVGSGANALARLGVGAANAELRVVGGAVAWGAALVFNVKNYGAKGDGTTDDTVAIQAAVNAVIAAGGYGTVVFPPTPSGTYICNGVITPNQSTGYIIFQGQGMYATTLLSTLAGPAVTLQQQMPGEARDMTIDGGGVVTNVFAQITTGDVAITQMAARRVRMRNCADGAGWVHVVWDQASAYQISRYYLDDCVWEGPSSTINDGATITYVDTCYISNLRTQNLYRSPNLYVMRRLIANGIVVGSVTGTSAFVIDAGVLAAYVSGLVSLDTAENVVINAPLARVSNSSFATLASVNNGAIATSDVQFENCDFSAGGVFIAHPLAALKLRGGSVTCTGTTGVVVFLDGSPGASVQGDVEAIGVTINNAPSGGNVVYSLNGTTFHGAGFSQCKLAQAPTTTNTTLGVGFGFRNCQGYNPVGVVTPAVPATTVAVPAVPYDRTFYITTTAAVSVAISGGPTITLPTAGVTPVRVTAGQTLTPTYAGAAPTWVVEGD